MRQRISAFERTYGLRTSQPCTPQEIDRRSFLWTLASGAVGWGAAFGQAKASGAKITGIETIALEHAPDYSLTLVRVQTDSGVDGLGQAESPSLVIDAALKTRGGLEDLLRGEDPLQVERLWQKMYSQTALWGRRGVTIAAIGAVETALWDIAGKLLGKPVSELVWRSVATSVYGPVVIKDKVRPYATVWTPGQTEQEIRARFQAATDRGFQAVKLENYPGGFGEGDVATDARIVRWVREVIGKDRDLLVDVANKWQDVGMAIESCKAIAPFNIYLVEGPFAADNLDAFRRLADAVDLRIAAGDWGFTTRFEFRELMERGGVDVVQPSLVRSGGIAEISRIAEMAFQRGVLCVPHAWNAMVGIAAGIHLAAILPNMPYVEFPVAFPPSPLISELLVPKLAPDSKGWLEVPKRPGLGFTLNEEIVRRYRVPPS